MNRLRSLLLLALLISAGCARSEISSGFFRSALVATFPPPPAPAATVTISELAAEPAAFAGQYVRVTGQYQRPALFVCESLPRHSPAAWTLGDGEANIGAGGFDELLLSLISEGLAMTVEGRWQQWSGPIGCGKTASIQESWYLAVQAVVEPQPLVRVTLTPVGGIAPTAVAGVPAGSPTAAGGETALPTPTGVSAITPGAATPTVRAPTVPAGTGTSQPYPGPATTAITLTATATLVSTPADGTPQPTITGTLGTATATVEAGSRGTPQATATEPAGEILDRGNLTFRPLLGNQADFSPIGLVTASLGREASHRWHVQVQANDVITVSAAAQPDRDIVLQLRDPAGNIVVTANERGAGEVEIIEGYAVPSAGDYQLFVREADLNDGDYALLYINSEYDDTYRYEIAGLLRASGSASATMPADTDYLWLFMAEAGNTISITVSPSDNSNPILNLLGPEGNLLYQYIDDSGPGQSELILNASLNDSGLYVLHVGEGQYLASSYRVTVTGN